jgi:hypothetical protein
VSQRDAYSLRSMANLRYNRCRRRVPQYLWNSVPREMVLQLVKDLIDLRLPNLHISHKPAGNRHTKCP